MASRLQDKTAMKTKTNIKGGTPVDTVHGAS
jgi:hypothetical protein